MISFTTAQLDAWIVAFVFPLTRILGLIAVAPPFNDTALNVTAKVILGLAITFALAPIIPPMPAIPAGSWIGLAVLAQQLLIGIALGFVMRIAFAGVTFAGELIGLQMGLSFAVFFDPQNTGQTPVVAEFVGLIALLIFLASNGHLMTLAALTESFTLLPVTPTPFAAKGFAAIVTWAATLFSTGLLLALPLVAALLIANVALGVLSRVAPQLNLFAVGFPVTIVSGFIVLTLSLPYFGAALERLFDQSFAMLRNLMQIGAG
jgi:flagellar biosynthetic protein FliR